MIAEWIVRLVAVYVVLGLLFAVPFVWIGAGRIDPDAREGSFGFRLAVLPGAIALWPYLVFRWRAAGPPTEHNAHRDRSGR